MASVDITLQQLYDMIKSGAAGVPIGTIVDYYGTTAPSGWLICDGQNVPDSMPQLKALIGSKVPDLRGRFRRMIGGNAAGIGVAQDMAIQSHSHTLSLATLGGSGGDINWGGDAKRFSGSSGSTGGVETRPINMVFNTIIYGGGGISLLLNWLKGWVS